ncbi:sensor histidine kinase [Jannaschia sp. R86511]|uniref:sensor histidine kinase n=1 Tax=Jannaschia sp. R86511 TaxID=3093853 RepID=UPI0036D3820D
MVVASEERSPLSRTDRVWVLLPYALLVVCAVVAAASGDLADVWPGALTGLAAVLAWHGWWVLVHPQWLEVRLAPMAVYFIGLVALTDYLTCLSFTFFPLYLVCYPMAFVALPGAWAYAGVGLTALVAVTAFPGERYSVEDVVVGLGAAALVCVVGGAIRALEAETVRRRAALATLARTHADLERALAENVALQDRLVTEARQAGTLAERSRLAGEIHDTLAAGLAGVVSQLEAMNAELPPDHPLRARVDRSADLARDTLQEARRSVRALRPGALTRTALPGALRATVEQFEQAHRLPVHLRITGDTTPVPTRVEDVLLRAAHEALTNTARHARASSAHVTLSFFGDAIAVDVADDGTGTQSDDPGLTGVTGRGGTGGGTGAPGGGHGLSIMRERVEALGGQVQVDSSPTGGTTVTATVPLLPRPVDA